MSREKEFLEYVLSSVLAMVGQSIYILADTYFVARGLGANGLAALNLAIPIYNFINGVGLMLGIGGAGPVFFGPPGGGVWGVEYRTRRILSLV